MPTVIIPDKICPHCGGIEWIEILDGRNKIVKIQYRCVVKNRESVKKYRKGHKEVINKKAREKGYHKNRYLKNKTKENERVNTWRKTEAGKKSSQESCKKHRKKNTTYLREYNRKYHNIGTRELKPFYLRGRLRDQLEITNLDIDLPDNLLTLKYNELCLKRQVKLKQKQQ